MARAASEQRKDFCAELNAHACKGLSCRKRLQCRAVCVNGLVEGMGLNVLLRVFGDSGAQRGVRAGFEDELCDA